jgi:undecaprenyl-diphosphatase
MEQIIYLKAILLGILEGLTEFLPVSSTGHLIVASNLLNFNEIPGKTFEIIIQLGAILAVCFLYRKKLFHTVLHLKEKKSQNFTINILAAFLPAAILGALLHDFIKSALFSPLIVAISLIIGGIIMIIVERLNIKEETQEIEDISAITAVKIGLFQAIAMIPGVSRSGSTIIGGMILKLPRKVATEFSFFLAIPTMLGATVFDIYKNHEALSFDHGLVIMTGFIAAFLSALLIIKPFVLFISKNGFTVFGYYRIIVGALILLIM